jgi:O-antigen/teichoic acid export membrane protein
LSTPDVDSIVEQALEAEVHGGKHDPRIDRLYRQDVITIYIFVVALWLVLWTVFFLVANTVITDDKLRWLLIGLGVFASIFNSVGMISNTRRLKHEAVRFYSQDLFWQDEKKRRKAEGLL